jgi:2-alkyl-3-oxoalkanoate reductase
VKITAGVRRFVHVSSPAVIFTGRDHLLERDDAPYPERFSSHYALSKKRAEELALEYRDRLELIVLRPKAIYGPGDRALLPRVVAAARAGRFVQIGDGENRVDLTFVSDAVDAIVLALERPDPRREFPVYTVTSGEHPRLWDVIARLLEGLDLPSKFRKISVGTMLALASVLERVARVTGREPRLTRYGVELLARSQTYDISRVRADLGFEPKVPFEVGLARTLEGLR